MTTAKTLLSCPTCKHPLDIHYEKDSVTYSCPNCKNIHNSDCQKHS